MSITPSSVVKRTGCAGTTRVAVGEGDGDAVGTAEGTLPWGPPHAAAAVRSARTSTSGAEASRGAGREVGRCARTETSSFADTEAVALAYIRLDICHIFYTAPAAPISQAPVIGGAAAASAPAVR